MSIKVCLAGVTGWTGSVIARKLLENQEFELVGSLARQKKGQNLCKVLGLPDNGLIIKESLQEVLAEGVKPDVLVDYTSPGSVKARTFQALEQGINVVIGTSGLNSSDYDEIEQKTLELNLGVIAAGNFSITAALAKHFALLAAHYLPAWEIVDYAGAAKVDAPSGTTLELAEALGKIKQAQQLIPPEEIIGPKEVRGATVGGTQIHSVRLPSYIIAFETIFGLPDERLTIRHDAGSGAEPYAAGTLLAIRKAVEIKGLIRGLDQLLFSL